MGVTLGDLARVTVRGGEVPPESDAAGRALRVYRTVVGWAQRGNAEVITHDVNGKQQSGYRWHGNVSEAHEFLWPEGEDNSPQQKMLTNRYLAQTGNMVCLARPRAGEGGGKSTWWVRTEWSAVKPMSGKDRAEAIRRALEPPVTVEYLCGDHGLRFDTKAARDTHLAEEHNDTTITPVLEVKRNTLVPQPQRAPVTPKPIRIAEAKEDTASEPKEPAEASTVTASGARESAAAKVDTVTEVRHEPSKYPCREPGCGEGSFANAYDRHEHEATAHPESATRLFRCYAPDCGRDEYSLTSLARHINRGHHILKGGDGTYETLMELSVAESERRIAAAERKAVRHGRKAAAEAEAPPEPRDVAAATPATAPEPKQSTEAKEAAAPEVRDELPADQPRGATEAMTTTGDPAAALKNALIQAVDIFAVIETAAGQLAQSTADQDRIKALEQENRELAKEAERLRNQKTSSTRRVADLLAELSAAN